MLHQAGDPAAMKYRFFFLILVACAALPFAAFAAGIVDINAEDGQETITVAVPDISPHKVFTVDKPDRLVVDVPSIGAHPKVALPQSYDGSLIKKLRYGLFNPETSRFVFDLNQPVHVVDVREENARKGDVLVI